MNKLLIAIAALSLGCNESNKPKQAADDYCNCYTHTLSLGKTEMDARRLCDIEVAIKYKELNIYFIAKEDTSIKWDDVVKFYDSYIDYRSQQCDND